MVGQYLILMNADALMRLWRAKNRRGGGRVKGEVWGKTGGEGGVGLEWEWQLFFEAHLR